MLYTLSCLVMHVIYISIKLEKDISHFFSYLLTSPYNFFLPLHMTCYPNSQPSVTITLPPYNMGNSTMR